VRELMNLCERLVVMSDTETIDTSDLPPNVTAEAGGAAPTPTPLDDEATLDEAIARTERVMLLRARQRHGNQTDMARALGVNQSTIARKLKRYGIT
jgi:DNA-binding NtrC family response regulator